MVTALNLVGAGQAYIDAGLYAKTLKYQRHMLLLEILLLEIDGFYSEHYQNVTDTYALDASALFTEFYFDVGDQHKITLGLRYTEDTKSVKVNNYFYKVPLVSAWNPLDGTGITHLQLMLSCNLWNSR